MEEKIAVCYIAGPISDLPNNNEKAFYEAQKFLEFLGFAVINVFEIQKGQDVSKWTWIDYIMFDLPYLAQCDMVYFLDGWEKSYGAMIEMMVAFKMNKELAFESPLHSNHITLNIVFEPQGRRMNGEAIELSEDEYDIGDWFDKNMNGEIQ